NYRIGQFFQGFSHFEFPRETTVTDLGSSLMINLPFWIFAVIGFGVTVFGASKVFTLSTVGAVSVSPCTVLALRPGMFTSISTNSFGSTFVTSSQSLPVASLAAMATTRGSVIPEFV